MRSRFARNTVYGSIAGGTATVCSFVSTLVIARQLGVQETGHVVFALWIAATSSVIIAFGIPFTVSRFLPDIEARSDPRATLSIAAGLLRKFFVSAAIPFALAIIIASCVSAFGAAAPLPEIMRSPSLVLLIGLLSSALALAEFARSFSRGVQRFDELAKASIASAIMQVAAALILIKLFGIQGALFAFLVGAVAFLPLVGSLARVRVDDIGTHTRQMRSYAAFRWGSEILALFVWSRVEVLFLQSYSGPSSVALFLVGLTLSNLAIQGPMMLTWGLMPHFVEQLASGDKQNTQRTYAMATRLLAALVLPACFGLAAITHVLVPLLYGSAFASASGVAEILIVAAAYPAIASVGSSLILATDRSDVDFYTCLVGTFISVVLGVTLTKNFGPHGAAASRIIVQMVVVILATGFLVRRLGLNVPLVSLAKLTGAAICCALVAALIVRSIPTFGVAGIGVAVAAGAATYVICLRYLKVFEPGETEVMRQLAGRLPSPLTRVAFKIIGLALEPLSVSPQPFDFRRVYNRLLRRGGEELLKRVKSYLSSCINTIPF